MERSFFYVFNISRAPSTSKFAFCRITSQLFQTWIMCPYALFQTTICFWFQTYFLALLHYTHPKQNSIICCTTLLFTVNVTFILNDTISLRIHFGSRLSAFSESAVSHHRHSRRLKFGNITILVYITGRH